MRKLGDRQSPQKEEPFYTFTVIGVIKKFGSKDSITTDCNGNYKEPFCEDLFPPKGRLEVKLPIRGTSSSIPAE